MKSVHFVVVCCVIAAAASLFQLMRAGFTGSLFSYHPVLMCLGFGVLLPIGVSQARLRLSAGSIETRVAHVQRHVLVQLVATVLIAAGFAAIFLNKRRAGKDHFTTWHAWAGLLAVCCVVGNAATGMYRSFSRRTQRYPALWHSSWHRTVGAAALALGALALYLGFASDWTLKLYQSNMWIQGMSVSFYAMCALLAYLAVMPAGTLE